MRLHARNPRALLAGAMFIVIGGTFLVMSLEFRMGTARRMGPGYFPTALSCLLIAIGVALAMRGVLGRGAPVGRLAWRELGLVTLGIVLFGLLIRGGGIAPAVAALVAVAAFAERPFHAMRTAVLATAMVLFSWLVFGVGLGLPLDAFGSWFPRE